MATGDREGHHGYRGQGGASRLQGTWRAITAKGTGRGITAKGTWRAITAIGDRGGPSRL